MVGQRRRLGRLVVLMLLVAVLAAPAGLAQAALVWQTEAVDADGDVGFSSSVAIDGQNRPHISYFDTTNGDLKYARFDGSSWHIETVDSEGRVGGISSLALDSQGHPHISYSDITFNVALKYARFDGTTWQIETIDSSGDVGRVSSLVLDSQGRPHISYYDEINNRIKYAHYDGTTWQIETIDSAGVGGWDPTLVLDDEDRPHISYLDNATITLKYMHYDGTTWQIESVESSVGLASYSSLALDSQRRPHISYLDLLTEELKYAYYDGTAWQIESVDSAYIIGQYTTLALDSQDRPHIGYYALDDNAVLKYALRDGNGWQIETIDDERSVGQWTSLAVDSLDQPHISYWDATHGDLRYAHATLNEPPTVEAGGPYSGTEGSPITLDGMVSDPENDALTTTWSYTIDTADPGTTCAFGDPNQVDTTITCTDDGTFTLTLSADDGTATPVSDTATLTISNAEPVIVPGEDTEIDEGDVFSGNGSFSDPGTNDTHTATVYYGEGAGPQPLPLNPDGTFNLSHTYANAGQYTVAICVTDDDGGQGCDELVVEVVNQPPTIEAGGPYTGTEGSLIALDGAISDPEDDELTISWSYVINSADPGTTCTFGDAAQIDTTITCTDDGSFTVTLEADDGNNPPVTGSASVSISNLAPSITDIAATVTGSEVIMVVTATDPGLNDVLSYAFDCDNDGGYEVDAGTANTGSCPLATNDDVYTIGVQVSDGDGGVATGTVTVTVPIHLCASTYTGVLRYTADCQPHETAVTIPGEEPVEVCASTYTGLLRTPVSGGCEDHETSYVLPDDGSLTVCVNGYTLTMRAVDDLEACQPHEFRKVIAATEVSEGVPPSPR